MNNPLTRKSSHCPLCDGPKDIDLVACWSCFRVYDMRMGNPAAEAMIARHEASLKG